MQPFIMLTSRHNSRKYCLLSSRSFEVEKDEKKDKEDKVDEEFGKEVGELFSTMGHLVVGEISYLLSSWKRSAIIITTISIIINGHERHHDK